MYVCFVCLFVCMYACMYVYVCVHIIYIDMIIQVGAGIDGRAVVCICVLCLTWIDIVADLGRRHVIYLNVELSVHLTYWYSHPFTHARTPARHLLTHARTNTRSHAGADEPEGARPQHESVHADARPAVVEGQVFRWSVMFLAGMWCSWLTYDGGTAT